MIDHLLLYSAEVERSAAWPMPTDAEGHPIIAPSWADGTRVIMPVRIVLDRAVHDIDGNVVTSEVVAPGFYLVIRTPGRDAELEAMAECVIATDAGLMAAGKPYVIKCSLQPETILGQIDPVWAGSSYNIPVGEPAAALDEWRVA